LKISRSLDIETIFLKKKHGVFLKNLKMGRHPTLRPFLRKAWRFLRILRWAGHPILRQFLRKVWSFLRILRSAGHPILRLFFFRKSLEFL
jgi:hypothetical protein